MLQKYSVGIQDFSELRVGRYLYIDKTQFAEKIATEGKYYFLSRPRRFGKSLFLSTLDYLYQGRRELFEGLYIDGHWDWHKTHSVVKISFSNIGHKTMGLERAIQQSLDQTAQRYGIVFIQETIDQKFKELIESLYKIHGKVVVLIDEYDKPIIDYVGTDTEKAISNRDTLKVFYSILKDADPYLELVFITGVSKFSRVSIFSDLNNLTDLSAERRFSDICGITQDEMESNFVEELKILDHDKIRSWYNGYSFGAGNHIYNPFSLLHFFRNQAFKNYWFESGTPTFLVNLTKTQQLYDFEGIEVSANGLNAYDLDQLQLLPLMFQTGYLTIKDYNEEMGIYTLDYPNLEVRQSYIDVMLTNYMQDNVLTGKVWVNSLKKALEAGQVEKIEPLFNSLFKSIPYEIWQKENEHFYHAIIHLTFRLFGIYVESQVQTSDGRMDALVQTAHYVYCFEFKLTDTMAVDGAAELALQQIKDKGYLQPYLHQGKKCIAIGINFSKTTKKVAALLWQEILQ